MRMLVAAMVAVWVALCGASAQDLSALARLDPQSSSSGDTGQGVVVSLALSQPVPWRLRVLDAPPRLVLDVREVDWSGIAQVSQASVRVTELRAGVFRPGWSRLVMEMTGPFLVDQAEMRTTEGSARLVLRLEPASPGAFAAKAALPEPEDWAPPKAADLPRPERRGDGPVVVVLDPGHGGIDPGAEREGLSEAELMLTFARELKETLLRAGGFTVILTRNEDVFVPLETRISIASAAGASVFLSLHADALAEGEAVGATIYTLAVTLELINLSDTPRTVDYELQGPVGVLFENEEHSSKYRDIHIEFVDDTKPATLAAGTIDGYCIVLNRELARLSSPLEQRAMLREDHEWTSAFRYAGVDVQFFAALVAPLDDRSEEERRDSKWLERTYPVLIARNPRADAKTPDKTSDISVRMASLPVILKAKGEGDSLTHKYAFFVGPKRRELLDPAPLQASQVLNYGMFGFVARGMHYLLDTFFSLGLPYFLAIVSLTVLVRGCLFPISRKQAIMAARQKELQPQLTLLKEKYADEKEKLRYWLGPLPFAVRRFPVFT